MYKGTPFSIKNLSVEIYYELITKALTYLMFQICEFLLDLHEVAGEGFGIDMTDTLQGETGNWSFFIYCVMINASYFWLLVTEQDSTKLKSDIFIFVDNAI